MKARQAVAVAAVIGSLAGGSAAYAEPPVTAVPLEQGVAIPSPPADDFQYVTVASASDDYLLHDRWQYRTGSWALTVMDARDGSTVRTLAAGWIPDDQPRIVGSSYLVASPRWSAATTVAVHSVATGQVSHTFEPGGRHVLLAGEQWLLVDGASGPATFLWADGHEVPVPDLEADPTFLGADVVSGGDSLVDPVTGEVTHFLDEQGGRLDILGGTDRRIWAAGTVDGTHRLFWFDRGASAPAGSVAFPWVPRELLVPWGEGLAVLEGTGRQREDLSLFALRPLDLETGERLPPLADDVVWWRSGTVGAVQILRVGDGPGTLSVADGSGVHEVGDLPTLAQVPIAVGLAGPYAVAGWSLPDPGHSGPTTPLVQGYQRARIRGSWAPAYASAPTPGTTGSEHFVVGGSALLDPNTLTLTWPDGGQRVGVWSVSRNGSYLLRRSGERFAVRRAGSGELVRRVDTWHVGFAGRWLWRGPDDRGWFRGVDLRRQKPDRVVRPRGLPGLLAGDAASLLDVRGGFGLLWLRQEYWLVDLEGELAPWQVPVPWQEFGPLLGDGFVTWVDGTYDGFDATSRTIQVADLTAAHETRSYGPATEREKAWGSLAVNSADRADLVYLDQEEVVRHVSLDWLGTPRS